MLVATFVHMSVMLSVSAVLRTSFVKLQSSDLVSVDSNSLSNLGTVGSTIECSCMCSSKSDCGGFYFNEADGSCWGTNTGQTAANTVSYYKDCGTPPAITKAVLSAGGTHAGETRTYSCSSGYVLRNVVTLDTTCQSDGTWSTPSFDCLMGWCNTDEVGCPYGWCHVGTSCYRVYNSTITLGDGLTFCQNAYYSSYMLQLETVDEDAAVVSNIMQNDPSAVFCFGLHDPLKNNVWKWMATSVALTYSNWLAGQPDGSAQYYVQVAASDNYQWRDLSASSRCQPLCEISLQ